MLEIESRTDLGLLSQAAWWQMRMRDQKFLQAQANVAAYSETTPFFSLRSSPTEEASYEGYARVKAVRKKSKKSRRKA